MPRGEALDHSTLVVDREGRLLRPYATGEGRWRLPATLEHVDRRYVDMLLAYEDRRFRSHPGVDPLAMGRAALQFVTSGRIVSGGSTITMQVARLLEPRDGAQLVAKLRQAVRAIQLERVLTKDEVLALYLSLAPYGGNLEGIRAASLSYFGKEPRRLSMAEAALLVALPQSPEARRPDRSAAAARAARDRVLDRIAAAGEIPADEVALRQARRRADWPQADAGAGAACGRTGHRGGAAAKNPSPDHRRAAAEIAAGAGARAGEGARPRHIRRNPRGRPRNRARCGRASPRPTISTSVVPARSI